MASYTCNGSADFCGSYADSMAGFSEKIFDIVADFNSESEHGPVVGEKCTPEENDPPAKPAEC